MASPATHLRRGQAIEYKGDRGVLLEVEHRSPGKGAGFVQVIMRSFASGKSRDIKFAASERVEIVQCDRRKLEYSYSDPSGHHFMDPENYETLDFDDALVAEVKPYLVENLPVDVLFADGAPVALEPPGSVELEVTEAPEGIKGDSATGAQKTITLETGLEIQAPLFINPGDRVRVEVKTGKYMARV